MQQPYTFEEKKELRVFTPRKTSKVLFGSFEIEHRLDDILHTYRILYVGKNLIHRLIRHRRFIKGVVGHGFAVDVQAIKGIYVSANSYIGVGELLHRRWRIPAQALANSCTGNSCAMSARNGFFALPTST